MSPSIYAALIDSLFHDPGPMFAGALCAAVAAVMTALKTGNVCCGRASRCSSSPAPSARIDTRRYKKRSSQPDRR